MKVRVTVNLLAQLMFPVTSLTKLNVVAPPQLSVALTPVVVCAGTALAHVTVTAAGQVMLGAMLSNTVMICAHVAVLLHTSLARNVRVTVNLLAQMMLLVTSPTKLNVVAPLQLSVALTPAVVCAGIADAQVTVTAAGQVMLGDTLSNTVMIWLQVAVLLQMSDAMNVRVTVNLLAQLTLLVTSLTKLNVVAPPQLSVALTPVVVCAGIALAHVTVTGPGQVIVGTMLSFTVMIWLQVAVLLHKSVAMNKRVTVNLFPQRMLLVTSLTKLKLTAPLQLSVALTPLVVCAGIALAHVTVNAAGQVMLGATLSNTVMV
jgi:hypothetical protein